MIVDPNVAAGGPRGRPITYEYVMHCCPGDKHGKVQVHWNDDDGGRKGSVHHFRLQVLESLSCHRTDPGRTVSGSGLGVIDGANGTHRLAFAFTRETARASRELVELRITGPSGAPVLEVHRHSGPR